MGFDRELGKRLPVWVEKGLLTESQANGIRAFEDEGSQSQGGVFLSRMMILGAILAGTGLLSFVAANWRSIPDLVRSVMVWCLLAAPVAGAFVASKRGREGLSEALFTLSCLAFGANIGLQAQIFHIPSSGNSGILLWFAGCAVLALAGASGAAGVGAMAVGLVWAALETVGFADGMRFMSHDSTGRWAFLWFGAMWLSMATVVFTRGGKPARFASVGFFLAGMAGLMVATVLWRGSVPKGGEILGLFVTYCMFLIAVVFGAKRLLDRFEDAGMFLYAGISALALCLFFLTSGFLKDMSVWHGGSVDTISWLIGAGLLSAGGYAFAKTERSPGSDFGFALMGAWVVALTVLRPPAVPPMAFLVATNVLYAASLVWGVKTATEMGSARLVNTCFLMFAVWAIARYFDTFGSLLGGSLAFGAGGLFLMGLAVFLDKRRRAVNASIRGSK